ncbi:hypothetical protein [Paenibacillus pinihumi]|uniref:hypothetical protein n=1 Tax=Paenibacillus pinihumi TaxID=669462 RepID=UPI000420D4A1|nr:hypothetical protein [Paenibacillus pinihumi]
MFYKTALALFLIVVVTGCTQDTPDTNRNEPPIIIQQDHSIITLVQTDQSELLNLDYQLTNPSGHTTGPFYTEFIFHHDELAKHLDEHIYSIYERIGMSTTLLPDESYRGGVTLEIPSTNKMKADELKAIIEDQKAIEIRLIHAENGQLIAQGWMHIFEVTKENWPRQ